MDRRSRARQRRAAILVAVLTIVPLTASRQSSWAAEASAEVVATDWVVPASPVQLVITTEGGAPVVSRDDYVTGSMQLGGVTHPLRIKGRGNSTWQWSKKPYKLNLDTAAGLLGLPAQEEWVLLANYADRTSLRNHLALGLAGTTRLLWSPDARFVDVVLNGTSQGLYLLTDQVELGSERVLLPEDGFLLEIDQRYRSSGDPGFRSDRGTPVSFKDPDDLTRPQRREVKRAVRGFEDVLYGDDFADPEHGYAAHIDVDSVVDWYLVEELFRNQDSNFHSSVYVTWTPDDGFTMGPVWDFDLSAGTKWKSSTVPQGWHTRNGRHWVSRMFKDPAFSARVKARWTELRPTVDAMLDQVPAAGDAIRTSAQADAALWPMAGDEVAGSVHAADFDGEVSFLRSWLAQRSDWMSRPEVGFGRASWTVREKSRVVDVPVRILGGHDGPVSVQFTRRSGTATPGSDFTMADGTLTFAPGETLKTFPVTILGDRRPEAAETVKLALSSSYGNPRLAQPSRVALTIGTSDQRPDAMIRRAGSSRFVGDDVYNRRGGRQTQTVVSSPGRTRSFEIRVANDGTARSDIVVKGSSGTPAAKIRYYAGGNEITRAMRTSSGWAVTLRGDRHRRIRVAVEVRHGADRDVRSVARVKTVWRGDVRRVDVVKAVVVSR